MEKNNEESTYTRRIRRDTTEDRRTINDVDMSLYSLERTLRNALELAHFSMTQVTLDKEGVMLYTEIEQISNTLAGVKEAVANLRGSVDNNASKPAKNTKKAR